MFEKNIQRKVNDEIKKISTLESVSKNTIKYSDLDPFIKSFLDIELDEISDKDNLKKNIEKAVKLNFNYTIRPKWTITNYIFGSKDSKSVNEVLKKISIFRFYKYYEENIKSYIEENKLVVITRSRISDIIDTTDTGLHDKLLTSSSGLKTKNFFLQIFKLKYPDINSINLNSGIPFGCIRIFLEDKLFTGLVEKFNQIDGIDDGTEIDLKTIIKIITGKFISKMDIGGEEGWSETPVQRYDEQAVHADDITFEEGVDKKEGLVSEKELEKSTALFKLFKKQEIEKISKKVFKNDRLLMFETLETINNLPDWNHVSEHLKELFMQNNVKLYSRDVVTFIDILQEYFSMTNKKIQK